jgi:hypothetical protein
MKAKAAAAKIKQPRVRLREELESDDDELEDAWSQHEEEKTAAKVVKGSESCTEWIKDFAGFFGPGAEPETGDKHLAKAPQQAAPATATAVSC